MPVYLLKCFLYIYKYLGPDKPSLLSYIHFPQVSNRYLISCGNARGDKNYPYLISSEKICFRNFYANEANKRSILFSLSFSKIIESYFHYKRSYKGEKNILITWSRGPSRTWP